MTKTPLKAVKTSADHFNLYAGEMKVPFGEITNCEVCWIFLTEDEYLKQEIGDKISGDMGPFEMLPIIRAAYDAVEAGHAAEAAADLAVERRTEEFYEGQFADDACRAELQADLAAHDAMFPNGYWAGPVN